MISRISPKKAGLKAFRQGDYGEALRCWQNMPQNVSGLQACQAEAHFRLGLKNEDDGIPDLQAAYQLQPNEGRFAYHLALAHHKAGRELDIAADLYEATRQLGGAFSQRAAFPLALLQLRLNGTGTVVALEQTAVWADLTAQQQTDLKSIDAILQKRWSDVDGQLWQGVAALLDGQLDSARTLLTKTIKKPHTAGLSHYYLGFSGSAKRSNERYGSPLVSRHASRFSPSRFG